jgi:hypothetical protein
LAPLELKPVLTANVDTGLRVTDFSALTVGRFQQGGKG